MIVLDTHVLVWWVAGASSLSPRARRALRSLKAGAGRVSTISVLEIATAVRRGRLALGRSLEQWLDDLQLLPELRFEPVTTSIARLAGAFPDTMPGDPADRIIVATAISLGAKLVTADGRLRATPQLQTLW